MNIDIHMRRCLNTGYCMNNRFVSWVKWPTCRNQICVQAQIIMKPFYIWQYPMFITCGDCYYFFSIFALPTRYKSRSREIFYVSTSLIPVIDRYTLTTNPIEYFLRDVIRVGYNPLQTYAAPLAIRGVITGIWWANNETTRVDNKKEMTPFNNVCLEYFM